MSLGYKCVAIWNALFDMLEIVAHDIIHAAFLRIQFCRLWDNEVWLDVHLRLIHRIGEYDKCRTGGDFGDEA